MKKKINIFWFRRDLRVNDNHGLYQALQSEFPVLPVFIFDSNILDKLSSKNDARVSFIYDEINKIKSKFEKHGGTLKVLVNKPFDAFTKLVTEYDINGVYTNKDYEPYATQRDNKIEKLLNSKGIGFHKFKDHVLFEENEILKNDGNPYTVFTPYSRKWKENFAEIDVPYFSSENSLKNLKKENPQTIPDLKDIGFVQSDIKIPELKISKAIIKNYSKTRNLPAVNGTTKLGIHLRFGTLSIREITKIATKISETFLNELIWRNFFIDILWHFPRVEQSAFKPKYDFIEWQNNETQFEKWCKGETGYPMVDAGMRELNTIGFMHNRVRMVAASFLTKHLLIDWRWGEAYFAEKLLDFELASNNGNWQWAAGCGCDAAPYFRIFNPETQLKKFDAGNEYVKKWIPEFETSKYPTPIVDHKQAREKALSTYKEALNS